ncbi:MAG: alginate export family protein, partial [Bacteroidales bacterium]|nr:alginate export family protein [Bacteroidales bacterium]
MKKKNIKVMISVLALFLMAGYAQAQFSLTGEFRTRGEANNGYKYIPVEGNDVQYYVSQRSRLTANYKSDKYDAKLTLQDVRAWGGEDIYSGAGVWGSSSGFDIYEAWVDVKTGTHSSIKVGRQELKYDDRRLLSWRNWNQYGKTYDAAVF